MKLRDKDMKRRCIDKKPGATRLAWVLHFWILVSLSPASMAGLSASSGIVIVGDEGSVNYLPIFLREMQSRVVDLPISTVDESRIDSAEIPESAVLVPVGAQALRTVLSERDTKHAIIASFVSSYTYNSILSESQDAALKATAVFTDPLIEDQISLASSMRAGTSHMKMGVFMSDSDQAMRHTIEMVSKEKGIQFVTRKLKREITPNDFIYLNGQNVNFMLLVPDPQLFATPLRMSIGDMILEAYGKNCGFIGFSRSLVKAGSVASVIYTEGQVAQRVVKVIEDYKRTGFLNPPSRPENISVAINRVVSKSLGLYKDDIQELVDEVKKNGAFSDSSFEFVIVDSESETYL